MAPIKVATPVAEKGIMPQRRVELVHEKFKALDKVDRVKGQIREVNTLKRDHHHKNHNKIKVLEVGEEGMTLVILVTPMIAVYLMIKMKKKKKQKRKWKRRKFLKKNFLKS